MEFQKFILFQQVTAYIKSWILKEISEWEFKGALRRDWQLMYLFIPLFSPFFFSFYCFCTISESAQQRELSILSYIH